MFYLDSVQGALQVAALQRRGVASRRRMRNRKGIYPKINIIRGSLFLTNDDFTTTITNWQLVVWYQPLPAPRFLNPSSSPSVKQDFAILDDEQIPVSIALQSAAITLRVHSEHQSTRPQTTGSRAGTFGSVEDSKHQEIIAAWFRMKLQEEPLAIPTGCEPIRPGNQPPVSLTLQVPGHLNASMLLLLLAAFIELNTRNCQPPSVPSALDRASSGSHW